MKIAHLKNSIGRDLYGKIECEHCGHSEDLIGGYDDGHWHDKVLPAFHCNGCGKNRAGHFRCAEVWKENRANGVNGHGAPEPTAKERLFDKLVGLAGYVENGTDTCVKFFQDDATKGWVVKIGIAASSQGATSYYGDTLAEAIQAASEG